MKQVASPLVLHSPQPIRSLPKPRSYTAFSPLPAPAARRVQPFCSPFPPKGTESNLLEALAGLQPETEDLRLHELAEVEKELFRRSVSFSTFAAGTAKTADVLPTRRSCPALFAPERPSNPMARDSLFNGGQGEGSVEGKASE